jgi:hypothetical protein
VSPELQAALTATHERVSEFVRVAMSEHLCCYDPATVTDKVTELLQPITDALRDQKEG